jgi:hypothetical protein
MKPEEYLTEEQYAQQKKTEYKRKKMRQQAKNNQKSQHGFGYEYKPLQFHFSTSK